MLYGAGGRGHILRPRPLSGNPARGDSMIGAARRHREFHRELQAQALSNRRGAVNRIAHGTHSRLHATASNPELGLTFDIEMGEICIAKSQKELAYLRWRPRLECV